MKAGRSPPLRSPTNVSLPATLVEKARELQINVSQACERGLVAAVAERRRERWLADNRAAMESWNAHVEEHGIPLSEFRQF